MPLTQAQLAKAKEIAGLLHASTHILACDYDGTLAPFVANPMEAKLAPSAKTALLELHNAYPDKVMIVTGRLLNDLNTLLRNSLDDNEVHYFEKLQSINAIGNQGFSTRINGVVVEKKFSDDEAIFLARSKNEAKLLCEKRIAVLNAQYGLTLTLKNLFEEKGESYGLHWRAISVGLEQQGRKKLEIEAVLKDIETVYHEFLLSESAHGQNAEQPSASSSSMTAYQTATALRMFEILEGNMVFEFKLRRVSKGAGLTEMLALDQFKGKGVVYLGDDYHDGKGTDASAAKVIKAANNGSIVIQVIDGEKAQTSYGLADLQIHTQHTVGEFLQEVVRVLHELKQQASVNNNNNNGALKKK